MKKNIKHSTKKYKGGTRSRTPGVLSRAISRLTQRRQVQPQEQIRPQPQMQNQIENNDGEWKKIYYFSTTERRKNISHPVIFDMYLPDEIEDLVFLPEFTEITNYNLHNVKKYI